MTKRDDSYPIPRLGEGDPCPNCSQPLRVPVSAQLRRNARLIVWVPIAIFTLWSGGGWGEDKDRVPKRDNYAVRCRGCPEVLGVIVRTWKWPRKL